MLYIQMTNLRSIFGVIIQQRIGSYKVLDNFGNDQDEVYYFVSHLNIFGNYMTPRSCTTM